MGGLAGKRFIHFSEVINMVRRETLQVVSRITSIRHTDANLPNHSEEAYHPSSRGRRSLNLAVDPEQES